MTVTWLELVASAVFGILGGVLSGFLGIGGGAILPPLFVFVLKVDQHRAQAISLAALLPPVGLPAVITYRRAGVRIDLALVLALIGGFVGGAAGGAWLAHRVPSRELSWFFAAFLAVSAWRAVKAGAVEAGAEGSLPDMGEGTPRPGSWLGLVIGAAAGVMSGLLGIGGGLVAIPMLRRFGRLGRLEAQATTLAMMLPPIGLPAVLVYAKEQGGVPWLLLLAVGAGFAVGAAAGARIASKVNVKTANAAYAALLVATAIALVLRA